MVACGPNLANRAVRPNDIVLHNMWAGGKVLDPGRIWARIKINVAQIWASSALFVG